MHTHDTEDFGFDFVCNTRWRKDTGVICVRRGMDTNTTGLD